MTAKDRADWLAEIWAVHVDECGRCTDLQPRCRLGEETDWLLTRAPLEGQR